MNKFRGDQRDWTTQYAAIGQFVVEFEWICWHLRHYACILLQIHGMRNWALSEIVFNQRSFTAEPLFSCYASMVAECIECDHKLIKELEGLRKEFQDLCKVRNDLLHATYLIGADVCEITDREKPIEVHVEKRTPDKRGARVKSLARTIDEQYEYVDIAIATKEHFKSFLPQVIVELVRRGVWPNKSQERTD